MLLRISGGHDGIKEYLETGQKAGREFTRAQMDERVTLAGDLELTNHVIQSIESTGERYLHITLALKEDHLAPELLKSIVLDFQEFAFSAYQRDEWNLYAEAHLPRLKSYIDANGREVASTKVRLWNRANRTMCSITRRTNAPRRFFRGFLRTEATTQSAPASGAFS